MTPQKNNRMDELFTNDHLIQEKAKCLDELRSLFKVLRNNTQDTLNQSIGMKKTLMRMNESAQSVSDWISKK